MKKTYIAPKCDVHKVDSIAPIALSSNIHNDRPGSDKVPGSNPEDNQFVKGNGAWDDQW